MDCQFHRAERRAPLLTPRAVEMADAIRLIVNRDGNVTEQALLCEGFTAAEIVEYYRDAEREARRALVVAGCAFDKVPEIIEKAIAAQAWVMPMTAGGRESEARRLAWRDYCTSVAAYKLDPWPSARERCLVRLRVFLAALPLVASEANKVVCGVATAFARRMAH